MNEAFYLKNYTEHLVDEAIEKLWADSDDICKCRRCYYDTKALSLNNLPAKYVVTDHGETYAKLDHLIVNKLAEVMTEVTKASIVVNNKYSHSDDQIVKVNFQ